MAKIVTYTPEQEQVFEKWVSERPPIIQEMIRKYPPDRLYWNKRVPSQRVMIESYSEDGTVTVIVSAKYNRVAFERGVFGVPVANLEECDLPGPDDPVGALLTDPEQIDEFIEQTRPIVLAARAAQDN